MGTGQQLPLQQSLLGPIAPPAPRATPYQLSAILETTELPRSCRRSRLGQKPPRSRGRSRLGPLPWRLPQHHQLPPHKSHRSPLLYLVCTLVLRRTFALYTSHPSSGAVRLCAPAVLVILCNLIVLCRGEWTNQRG
jgi:hypothetical protein